MPPILSTVHNELTEFLHQFTSGLFEMLSPWIIAFFKWLIAITFGSFTIVELYKLFTSHFCKSLIKKIRSKKHK